MEIVGEKNGDLVCGGVLSGAGEDAERQNRQENEENGQESFDGVHGFVLSWVNFGVLWDDYTTKWRECQ